MTSSKRFSTPSPVFPETSKISSGLQSRSLTTSALTSLTRASGESIFESTGIIISPDSRAMPRVVNVWACTPWVESTSNIDPSTAFSARETSYEKSICPGVSIKLRMYSCPSLRSGPSGWCTILTGCILIVIPLSRSSSIESRTWSCIFRASIVPVISSILSAKVDLPWSMWAIIEKFRIFSITTIKA